MVNPYETPATPELEAAVRLSLLRPAHPETATALWFVGVFAVHFAIVAAPAYLFGESSPDISPFVWLAFATGLYFRFGPVRRFVLLAGLFTIAAAVGGALAMLLSLAVDSDIPADLEAAEVSPLWFHLLTCIALVAAFAYPVVVLWPRHVRDRFRDRLPSRNSETFHST